MTNKTDNRNQVSDRDWVSLAKLEKADDDFLVERPDLFTNKKPNGEEPLKNSDD
ncbi:hypothetical protein [Photobacterium leiognathi]|uniref:hypothetical protein n=1 Tax=Photobacterium leiognathi TaxID=553611 RepID=UPI002981DDE4|nr:hypothetical protein [Photobacterium leiognathi]